MKKFFRDPSKVALTSLILTISMTTLNLGVVFIPEFDSRVILILIRVIVDISLILLMVSPLVGLVYSFFIKGKMKILYIILHLACISTFSAIALLIFMFRYFVPFAP
ncbi:MAG TPA: hypothetical protein DEO65_16460 [Bacillus bacterium]|uniref:Uncharacterized protein n=1 Tax=Siminovitchia fordii TaxID=254759 RepID=A0ABQ4K3D1_9BACI|nr:hypothetical protein J1TS3_07990 [Siminovitchia fordii]HBZ11431.1 hypothetical protein [Bacillus sp. (in: firmicutes)]